MTRFYFFIISLFLLQSCSKDYALFQNKINEKSVEELIFQSFSPKEAEIKPGDKITISIWGHEELSIGSFNSNYSSNSVTGRWILVNKDGEVNLPVLGIIKIAGYNIKEANYFLEELYKTHIINPIINVRVLNHFVTMLGEISSPGKLLLEDNVTLLEAIALCGGMTEFADPRDVKIIRQLPRGQEITLVIDLTEIENVSKLNVFIQPHDIIYVKPKKSKSYDDSMRRITPIITIVSAMAVIYSVLR